jgi:hypothetical protein
MAQQQGSGRGNDGGTPENMKQYWSNQTTQSYYFNMLLAGMSDEQKLARYKKMKDLPGLLGSGLGTNAEGEALLAAENARIAAEAERQKQKAERDLIYKTYLDQMRDRPGRYGTLLAGGGVSGSRARPSESQGQAINQMGSMLNVPNMMRGAIGD